MKTEPFSIFNDVIGPVMTGPSSSHTAAPARIGYMAKHLLEVKLKKAEFKFIKGGSFAASYHEQGTDRGLLGGLMGYHPDDPRMITALEDAAAENIDFDFSVAEFEATHPNTVRICIEGNNGESASATGISKGGGIIEITEVNGFKVSLTGKSYELLIFGSKKEADKDNIRKIAETDKGFESLEETYAGNAVMYDIRFSQKPDPETINTITDGQPDAEIRVLPPVFPVLSSAERKVPFSTSAHMTAWAKQNNYSPGEAGMKYEAAISGKTDDEMLQEMISIVEIMEDSVAEGLKSDRPGRIIKACSGDYLKAAEAGKLISCGAMDTAVAWTMAMVERNSYYARIVAAPTSGACGTVPGAVLGTAEFTGASKKEKAMALFAAGAIGLAIAEEGTFAAEICGCQAECGSASAMAAAGIVQLLGGTAAQACDAASIALQNVLGMICDSVANLVEVPCLGRNVLGAVNAISAANMVIAGEDAVIPLDEVIVSMMDVGKLMPPELCCTNSGGLAVTKTSRDLACNMACK